MDRLQVMTYLLTAVEAGSLSAAGRRLGVPLPTISRRIAELEAHLNARLLLRTTRALALTEAGSAYLATARSILEQVGEAERAAAGEYAAPKGELAVAAPIAFGRLHVLPVIGAFLDAYPEIDVRLVLSDRNADLVDEHIDIAVRLGQLPDSSMTATRLGAVRRIICGSPAFFAQHGEPLSPRDLARLPIVAFPDGAAWIFAQKTPAMPFRTRLRVNTAEAAVDAAMAGIGVTQVISYQAARAIRDGRLKIVLAEFEPAPIPVSVLHPAQARQPLKLRSFLDFAVPFLRKALAAGPVAPIKERIDAH